MKNQPIIAIIVVVVLLSLIGVLANASHKVELHQVELQTKTREIDLLQQKLDLNQKTKAKTQKELKAKQQQNKRLQDAIRRLQARKAEQSRIAASQSRNAVHASPEPSQATGSCADWMKQAGITDTANAHTLIMRESGCNPNAVNASSGACGIPQALPCSKLGTSDPVGQLRWMQSYVFGRYGSWANAVAHSSSNGWY